MKNYPLWKSLLVIIVIIASITFSIPTIIYSENSSNWFFNNKINLGLDLQGGSYLLLQVESNVLIEEHLENISDTVRQISRNEESKINNIISDNNEIKFFFDKNLSIENIRKELIKNYRDINVIIKDIKIEGVILCYVN